MIDLWRQSCGGSCRKQCRRHLIGCLSVWFLWRQCNQWNARSNESTWVLWLWVDSMLKLQYLSAALFGGELPAGRAFARKATWHQLSISSVIVIVCHSHEMFEVWLQLAFRKLPRSLCTLFNSRCTLLRVMTHLDPDGIPPGGWRVKLMGAAERERCQLWHVQPGAKDLEEKR